MTRYERISILISVVALACSVLVPIAINYFFSAPAEEIRYQGRLDVQKTIVVDRNAHQGECTVVVTNVGKSPVGGITIQGRTGDARVTPSHRASCVSVDPPVPVEYKASGPDFTVRLDATLAAGDSIRARVTGIAVPAGSSTASFDIGVNGSTGLGSVRSAVQRAESKP